MCGRYVSPSQADLERLWHVGRGAGEPFPARYNVAPTTQVPIVYMDKHQGDKRLMLARWGLIPWWWKEAKAPGHTFNARLEEAAKKAMWREPFRHARCIAPALGWYEWQEREIVDRATGEVRKYKQPFFLHLPDGRPIGFAGLMATGNGVDPDKLSGSCSILTMAATGIAAEVHHRMPVALSEAAHDAWLDRGLEDPAAVLEIIATNQLAGSMVKRAVSTRVNGSRADDPSLLEAIPATA